MAWIATFILSLALCSVVIRAFCAAAAVLALNRRLDEIERSALADCAPRNANNPEKL